MTPDQWRVIFYMQVLKSYRDVLSADFRLQRERYRAQIAQLREDSESDKIEEEEDEDILEEEVSLPKSIEEIDKALEQLKVELEATLSEGEMEEFEQMHLAQEIDYLTAFEPEEIGVSPSPSVTSLEKGSSSTTSSPSSKISATEDISSRSASYKTSSVSFEGSDEYEQVSDLIETPPSPPPPSPPPPLFPHIIVLGKTDLDIVGLGTIRLKPRTPLLPQIEEYCITDFTRIPRTPKLQTLPRGESKIYARSIRRPERPKLPHYPRPDSPSCSPMASLPQPRIKVEPYPNIDENKILTSKSKIRRTSKSVSLQPQI